MGTQASTAKNAARNKSSDSRRKGTKKEKLRIDILAFEVASVMAKSLQLWQSLSDSEICRFQVEVLKSEGVLNLVSDNDSVLLSLACLEKLQDLAAVAFAVSRLGKRCRDPALVGFEHIFNDVLKQTIDVQQLEFSQKEMEAKIKKMERCIGTTANLYQELEILAEMELAIKRLRDEGDPAQKDSLQALEQKVAWQRQEIKYLKEASLWNRTYEKVVGLLAKTVCTVYGRIIRVFGFPIMGWPQVLTVFRNREADHSGSISGCLSATEEPKISNDRMNGYAAPSVPCPTHSFPEHKVFPNGQQSPANGSLNLTKEGSISIPPRSSTFSPTSSYEGPESYSRLSICFSPGRQVTQQRSMSANYASRDDISLGNSPSGTPLHDNFTSRTGDSSGCLLPNSGPFSHAGSKRATMLHFDPKVKLQNAPPSTLGGAGLALHYANVVIIAEKMARYPHLISQDTRDDLYHMLPKNVQMALRSRLRPSIRMHSSLDYAGSGLAEWKGDLERVLGWLAPLAHNMIRWQSEHNFEQQHLVPRTNVLLLQTLYLAEQGKAEAAVTDLLVCLNHIWRHERDLKAQSLIHYARNKDLDEYLEWQL